MRFRSVLFAGVLLCLGTTLQAAETGLEKLTRFFDGVTYLSAEFSQIQYNQNLDQLQVMSGTFALKRPDLFRWEYKTPFEQLIVSDGKRLWVYDPDLMQVIVKKIDESLADSPMLIMSSPEAVEQEFDVIEIGTIDDDVWLELLPKKEDAQYNSVRISFSNDILHIMELVDSLGGVMRLEFSNIEKNVLIQDRLFQFVPPQGVDVVGEGS